MKKIICFILVLALGTFSMIACGGDDEGPSDASVVASMFSASQPTKSVVVTEQQFGTNNLKGVYSVVVGTVDGAEAAVEIIEQYRLTTVAEGSGQEILEYELQESNKREYVDGKGVRVNGGKWDGTAASIIPAKGAMAINLDDSLLGNVKYENKVLTFTVSAANSAAVFGEENAIAADSMVTVTNDGVRITGITITYTLGTDADTGLQETVVTITATYTYDLEPITIE